MRIFGLIGYPLTHSFSQRFFNDKFEKEQIYDVQYKQFSISSIKDFPDILNSDKRIYGFNVTSPYKEEIIPFLDTLDIFASAVNAVNVIKVIRDTSYVKLIGYNTDVYGFQNSVKKKLNSKIKSALILGTGGAAKAVSFALKKIGISYTFVSRNKSKDDNFLTYSELTKEIVENNLLIINATPVGIFPEIDDKPEIPYEFVSEKHYLFDLIYNPAETKFLLEGKKRNAQTENGLEMLHLQAEKAWEIFSE